MRVLYLSNRIPWFGAHTGYESLPRYAQTAGVAERTISPSESLPARALGRLASAWRGHGRISQSDAAARLRLEFGLRLDRTSVGHILYGEEHLPWWSDAPESLRRRTWVTLHQPSGALSEPKRSALRSLRRVIVLWQRERAWFQEHIHPAGKVHFIPHGVDTEFFSPGAPRAISARAAALRLLYVGIHMRNPAMLARVVARVHAAHPEVRFDLLVPEHRRRSEPALAALATHPAINWWSGLDDQALRNLYRSAHLLLLPLQNSGANTAIVEALACGLPIVTTDVGGIRDYGGASVFPVVENDDDVGMVTLIERYLADGTWRDSVARDCRRFAEKQLTWPLIARRHADLYREPCA